MDLLKQRLTFASMWAFEDIGVQELEDELLRRIPQAECSCEYSSTEEVLVVRGKLEGVLAPITEVIDSFIEKQKNKDLLDRPRLRVLDFPALVQDTSPEVNVPGEDYSGGLLDFNDDSSTLIPVSRTNITKFWLSSTGGAGCFAQNNHREMRDEVAKNTGTEIIVADDHKGLQISGQSEGDVHDVLARLDLIEKPLSCLGNPNINNIALGRGQGETRYHVQPYSTLGTEAPGRILADLATLGLMFVTVAHYLDDDTQLYTPYRNLVQPPLCNGDSKNSRIWNNFMFQEIGSGHEFAAMDSTQDNYSTDIQLIPSKIVANHPYLSPEKENQVKQWVADGPLPEVGENAPDFGDVASSQTQMVVAAKPSSTTKKAPAIKIRRVAASKPPAPNTAPNQPSGELQGAQSSGAPNRKRWMMQYEPDASIPPTSQTSATQSKKPINDLPNAPDNLDQCSTRAPKPGIGGPKPEKTASSTHSTQKPQANAIIKPLGKPTTRPREKHNMLVDIAIPVITPGFSHPNLLFDTPALVPDQPSFSSGDCSLVDTGSELSKTASDVHTSGLASQIILGAAGCNSSTSDPGHLQDASSSTSDFPHLTARLENLNVVYNSRLTSTGPNSTAKPSQRAGEYNRILEKQMLEGLERSHKPETHRAVDEVKNRKYHRTMKQKAGKPNQKSKTKAAAKQATLEDAWGMPKSKKPSGMGSKSPVTADAARKTQSHRKQEPSVDEDVKQLFEAMKSTLEAAEAFPGIVTLEIQFGLVIVPILPKTCSDILMSCADWSKIFQPRNGMPAPTTKFIDRLTVCGSEIDHIVDLKKSKSQGKSRMFEQDYSEYGISYEFHCRARVDELLIIAIDEQGGYKIQNPKSLLGAVNMHFPRRIWDARAVVGSVVPYRPGSHPEFEKVAKYLADHLWIPAEKYIRIHTSLPKESKMTIEKVFVKRWTRHRYLRADGPPSPSHATMSPEILLQVTEVQDLFIGIGTHQSSDRQYVRARYSTTEEMIQRGKVWYELSLVSSALETILKTNAALETGERTEEWRSSDLFGDAAASLAGQPSDSPNSPVAAAIGNAGIADLLRVSKAVAEKMDQVGACNRGPFGPSMQVVATKSQVNHGRDFDELESVKEVESVAARINPGLFDEETIKQEQAEKDYW
ncbi:hypothetical protein BDV06DRAFT_234275 [Aspergillus oleicola]